MRQVRPEQYLSRQQGYIAETASGLPGLSRVVAGLSAPPAPSRPIGSRRQREERFRANIPANRGAVPASSLKGSEAVMRMKGGIRASVVVSPGQSLLVVPSSRRTVVVPARVGRYLASAATCIPADVHPPVGQSHLAVCPRSSPRHAHRAPPICDVAAHPSPFHPSHHQTPD